MDPQAFPIVVSLSRMVDELRKRIAEGNAKRQSGPSALLAKSQTIDEVSDISELKATKAALMNEVRATHDDWLKAMESLYAVEDCLLTLCITASPSGRNLTPPHNLLRVSGFTILLRKMTEELRQRIAEEKAAQPAEVSVAVADDTDKTADVYVLKSEITELKAKLEVLADNWLKTSAASFAFARHLVSIGLVMAPSEG